MYDVPILLIGFNRPDILKRSLASILAINPKKLYIAIDGPRDGNTEDLELINEVIGVIENSVPQEIQVFRRYLDENVGAELNVSSAISWAFNDEDVLIVFEDDIVVDKVFFHFVEDMLQRYKSNENICMISGCNFSDTNFDYKSDYVFSKYGHTLGWATWKNRWELHDLNVKVNLNFWNIFKLLRTFDTLEQTLYHLRKFKMMKKKGDGNSSWDACWSYITRTRAQLSIVPSKNLSKNIGLFGLHSSGQTYHNRVTFPDYKYDVHPTQVKRNRRYDNHHFKNHFKHAKGFWKNLYYLLTKK